MTSDYYQAKKIFIATPGDLMPERRALVDVVTEVNVIKAHPAGFHFEILGWENTLPGNGRPQSLINAEIKKCDLFIMVLWEHWGTPSGRYSSGTEEEFYIEEMRAGFNLLDGSIENINELTEGEDGLDEIRVKALFYALYFGTDSPSQQDCQKFVSCFVTYEERTRTVTVEHEDGTITEEEETYTVAVSIEDLEVIYQNIRSTMGVEATEDQRSNAESI